MIKRLATVGLFLALTLTWADQPDSTRIMADSLQRSDSIEQVIADLDRQQQDMNKRLCAIKDILIQRRVIQNSDDSLSVSIDSTSIDRLKKQINDRTKRNRPTVGLRQVQGKQ